VTPTKDVGMGMGLAVSRSIIDEHGGELFADNNSTLGGARFTFTLPANSALGSVNGRSSAIASQ